MGKGWPLQSPPRDEVAHSQKGGLLSLENNAITNLLSQGTATPRAVLGMFSSGKEMCCLWYPSLPQEFHFMIDPSFFLIVDFFPFIPVLLPDPFLPDLSVNTAKPSPASLQHSHDFQTQLLCTRPVFISCPSFLSNKATVSSRSNGIP